METIPNKKFNDGMHRWQGDVLRAFCRKEARFFMLKWHRRARKTTLAINILIAEAIKNPNSVYLYVAPTYTQAKSIIWRDPNMLFSYLPEKKHCNWIANESELWIKFPNKSVITIKGADNPDSLRGIDTAGVVMDEWAQIKEECWTEIIRPIIAQDSRRWAIFAYTPKGANHATEMWRGNQRAEDWYCSILKASESNLIPKTELIKARREMPGHLYDQEFECADITDEEQVLITSRMLDNLRNITVVAPPHKKLITCDPALDKGDECVSYAMEDTKIIQPMFMRERDVVKIAGKVVGFSAQHNINEIIVDANGLGKGVADNINFMGKGTLNVTQYIGGSRANSKKYRNKRAEIWFYAWQQVMDKQVAYPEDYELRRQISSVRYIPADYADNLRIETKKLTIERLGHSPDRADAWVMGVWKNGTMPKPEYKSCEEDMSVADSYATVSVI